MHLLLVDGIAYERFETTKMITATPWHRSVGMDQGSVGVFFMQQNIISLILEMEACSCGFLFP